MMSDSVSLSTSALAEESGALIQVDITYRACEPYTLEYIFYLDEDNKREWIFSRELLELGFEPGIHGIGDVRTSSSITAGEYYLRLDAPGGRSFLIFSYQEMSDFLISTWKLVGRNDESAFFDADNLIARLAKES